MKDINWRNQEVAYWQHQVLLDQIEAAIRAVRLRDKMLRLRICWARYGPNVTSYWKVP